MNTLLKKAILLSVLFLLTIGGVSVIWSVFTESQPPKEWLMLGNPFSGFSTFRNEEFKKTLLEQAEISLKFENEFDMVDRVRRLNEGEAQLMVTTLDQLLQHGREGKIVGLIDRTIGADAIVLNTVKYSELKSLEALRKLVEMKGKKKLKITFAKNTVSEFLARVFDAELVENFELSDFEILGRKSTPEAWQSLQTEPDVALAVLFEPFITKATNKGYKVVFSTKDDPQAVIDVLVASNRLLKKQPDKISKFLELYYLHINSYLYEPELMREQIQSDDPELSPDEAKNIYEGIHFFTASEANDWLTNGKLKERIVYVGELLRLAKKQPKIPKEPEDIFTAQPIEVAVVDNKKICKILGDKPQVEKRICSSKPEPIPPSPEPTPPITKQTTTFPRTVYFVSGSSALTSKSQRELNDLAKKIQEKYPENILRVIGHTSNSGSQDYNLLLSQKRANTVAKYLNNLGPKNEIISEGKGFSSPLTGISPEDPRQQRAEIRLVQ